jgi:folate-binding protein YgfZ
VSNSARPGAVGSPPQHYGNPLGEQRALAAGDAIVDLSDRAVITVTGPDRLSWLDSLTSQALKALLPGESAETLLLDPTGHLEHAIRVIDDGVTTWLLVDGDQGAALSAWLERMRFMLRVEVVDRTSDFATVGTLGTQQLPAASPNGVALVWVDPWADVAAGGHQYAHVERHPATDWSYREVLVERGTDLSQYPAAGILALEALRIAAWRPRLATESDDKSIPHELDWLRSAVHLNKGCYRGQETVAKVHNLGHPPRRLVMLHLDGSEGVLPPAGSVVELDEKDVGKVTSSALHWELGPIALAVVKRSVDPGADLEVVADGIRLAAAQEIIVPTDAGAEANVPRLPRLGAVSRG